jgi:hypothetical protein
VAFRDWGGACIVVLASLTAVIGVVSARAQPPLILWCGRVAVVATLAAVVGAIADRRGFFATAAVLVVLLQAVAALAVLRAVITESKVGFRTILGAVSVYITLGLIFTFVYIAVDRIQSSPFFGVDQHLQSGDFLFFSTTTLTTTGYGNLVPAGQPGKIFAALEMLMGQIFLVTLIARLVSMWTPGQWLRGGRSG